MKRKRTFTLASKYPISEIFPESEPNKEKSRRLQRKAKDEKTQPLILSEEKGEDEESLSMAGIDWIKIGDEYFPSPAAIVPPQQVFFKSNEIETQTEPSSQSLPNKECKRKFEGVKLSLNKRFTNNQSLKSKEKYVKLHAINRCFKSETEDVEEEDHMAPFGFRTSRKFLYR